ncbi:hypothetical protein LSH36_181g04049 [Paralvinella palmiformis]|uniref:Protein kinase C n=1 Tax=Paralvinella palmiformis TaxID=53620 RepID=A0AAD9JTJ0_9ANNE|nr:hypothetical protein LSH36_181g04049 [Paralvinella palmiformis]
MRVRMTLFETTDVMISLWDVCKMCVRCQEECVKNHLNDVFPNVPRRPGDPCVGEDRNMYRRGARRWRKLYRVNGHLFQAKRFSRKAYCSFCTDRIWGLGRQGYKCINCKLLVHKKCHKLIKLTCGATVPATVQEDNGEELDLLLCDTRSITTDVIMSPLLFESEEPVTKTDSLTDVRDDSVNNTKANDSKPDNSDPSSNSVPADGKQWPPVDRSHTYSPVLGTSSSAASHSTNDSIQLLSADVQDDSNAKTGLGLADFELLRVIGRGSYAKVFMVSQKRTKRIYAMKVIKKELVNDDEDIDWVQTEKHVFEVASNHPFLVGLHSCFQTPSRLFFVIEFVNGGDLMFHMQRQRRLLEEHARFYAAEICLALNYLHDKGIVYRDLKLDNVLLDSEGHVKLTDYGMCKEGLKPGEMTCTFCGTPNYIAPEILRGVEYNYSVDWWALGVLMFEMMAGRSPFDIVGQSDNPDMNTEDYLFQVILEKPIRIPRSLSVKAGSVLKGFLNKSPEERLGCHPNTGLTDIQSHPFFRTIDWDLLYNKQITPPYKPHVRNETDLEHFDPQFTQEPVVLTPDDMRVINKIDQSEFEGFEYINPLLMSQEDCV